MPCDAVPFRRLQVRRTALTLAKDALLWSAILALQVGCAAEPIRNMRNEFIPTATDRFTYVVTANELHPINTAEGEKSRMRGLAQHLQDKGMCSHGYQITDRSPRFEPVNAHWTTRTIEDITYAGTCL